MDHHLRTVKILKTAVLTVWSVLKIIAMEVLSQAATLIVTNFEHGNVNLNNSGHCILNLDHRTDCLDHYRFCQVVHVDHHIQKFILSPEVTIELLVSKPNPCI